MTGVSDLFSLFDGPALVVTAQSDAGRSGCFVAFATQCSIYPPRLLVCLSLANHTTTVASRAHSLGVHVLRRDQWTLAALFAEESGDSVDKLATVAWREGRKGAPILEACSTWLEGSIVERLPLGDHVGYVLDVLDARSDPSERQPLRRSDAMALEPGHPAEEVRSGARHFVEGSE